MTPTPPNRPEYFRSSEDLAAWFRANPWATELWIGLWKKGHERPGISYSEVVDEALCEGWIDSAVRRVDEAGYMVRLTPRRPRSNWTDANLRRVDELRREGRLRPGGERAIAARRAVERPEG